MIGDEALNDEIRRLVEEGWILTSQSDNTAGMSRDGLAIFLEVQIDGPVRISGTGKNLAIDGTPVNIPPPIEKTTHRKVEMNPYISALTVDGWALHSQTETTASLTKPGERLNGCLVVLLLLLFLLPGLIYLFWPRKDMTVFLEVTDERINISGTGANLATRTLRALLESNEYKNPDASESRGYALGKAVRARSLLSVLKLLLRWPVVVILGLVVFIGGGQIGFAIFDSQPRPLILAIVLLVIYIVIVFLLFRFFRKKGNK